MYSNPPMEYLYHTPSYHPWSIPPTYPTNPTFTTPTTPSFPSFQWEIFTPCYTHPLSSSPKLYLNHGYSPHTHNPNPYSSSPYSYYYNPYHQPLQSTKTSSTIKRKFEKHLQVSHPSFKKRSHKKSQTPFQFTIPPDLFSLSLQTKTLKSLFLFKRRTNDIHGNYSSQTLTTSALLNKDVRFHHHLPQQPTEHNFVNHPNRINDTTVSKPSDPFAVSPDPLWKISNKASGGAIPFSIFSEKAEHVCDVSLVSDNHGEYYVVRNEISFDTHQVESVHSTTQDAFSLDVIGEAEDKYTFLEPMPPALGKSIQPRLSPLPEPPDSGTEEAPKVDGGLTEGQMIKRMKDLASSNVSNLTNESSHKPPFSVQIPNFLNSLQHSSLSLSMPCVSRSSPKPFSFEEKQKYLVNPIVPIDVEIPPPEPPDGISIMVHPTMYDSSVFVGTINFFSPHRNFASSDLEHWPFMVSASHGENPVIVVNYKGEDKQFAAKEISSIVPMKMPEITEAYLGSAIKNGVPDSTRVDLPGITRVLVHGQADNIYDQIQDIIMEYITPEESIILNVLSAMIDFTTCESIRMSQFVDKSGLRTLAVVTKTNKSSEALWEKVIMEDVKIGLGYVCVRNQIGGESYEEARNEEQKLFEYDSPLSKIDKSIIGILVLAYKLIFAKMNKISLQHVIKFLEREKHIVVLDHHMQMFVDIHDSLSSPLRVLLCSLKDGSIIMPLYEQHIPVPNFKELQLEPPKIVEIETSDGTILYGALYKPDVSRFGPPPYKAMIYVYGSPSVQLVSNSWQNTVDLRAQYMRNKGILVWKLDNRKTSRQRLKFEGYLKHKLGQIDVDDPFCAAEWLDKEGLAEFGHIGLYGWSYGGYLSAMTLSRYPDFFKCAIAGASTTLWDGYDTFYIEKHMGLPSENKSGYTRGSVMNHVHKLKGKLLLEAVLSVKFKQWDPGLILEP